LPPQETVVAENGVFSAGILRHGPILSAARLLGCPLAFA
jgi:hypothetical protein